MGKSPDVSKESEQWKALILEQQSSGLGIQAFCDQKQLTSSRFYYYRSLLFPAPKKTKAFIQAKLPAPVKLPPQLTATLYLDKFSIELTGDFTAAYLADLCRKLA
jgi:hypothetical protein